MTLTRSPVARRAGLIVLVALVFGAGAVTTVAQQSGQERSDMNQIVRLLADGQAVFGIFSGDHTAEQGAVMARNRETDFIFYSLESGPFDIPQMQAYMKGMADAAGDEGAHPVTLRIPPIRDGHEVARKRVRRGLDAGAVSITFPHVETVEEAQLAVSSMGNRQWPGNPDGDLINILLIEDEVGVRRARQIVGTPGVGVVIPGPGDLRRAYEGDDEAIENAIQTVLSACKEFHVPCGITAGVDDIGERLEQGFRLIIVTQPEALAVGRRAAGRE